MSWRQRLNELERQVAALSSTRKVCPQCHLPLDPKARAAMAVDRRALKVTVRHAGDPCPDPTPEHCEWCGGRQAVEVVIRFDRGEGGSPSELEPPDDEAVTDG